MTAREILDLKTKRAASSTAIRTIMDEHQGKPMDQAKKDEMAKHEGEFDNLSSQILAEEKQLERERVLGQKIDPPGAAKNEPENAVMTAFRNALRDGSANAIDICNALQQDNPTQAGYLVAPQQFMTEIIADKNNAMQMRQISRVLPPLSKAQSLGVVKRTNRMSTFAWGTEVAAPTADTALAFGKREFKPNPATGGILVSKTLIRNSAINAEAYIKGEMAYNQMENEEMAMMTGDGNGKPLGIFTASVDGISAGRDIATGNTATALTFDGLIEAKFNLKSTYHKGASWMFNPVAVKNIMKLKDSDGQYIWQPTVTAGTPDILLNLPVLSSEYAPKVFTAGLYVGVLGNFKEGYWIVDSLSLEIQALLEMYALTNQIFYIGRHEVDAAPVLEEAFSRIKLGA